MERIYGETPNGGVYSEAFFVNNEGKEVPKEEASRVIINECDEDGTIVNTTYGAINSN